MPDDLDAEECYDALSREIIYPPDEIALFRANAKHGSEQKMTRLQRGLLKPGGVGQEPSYNLRLPDFGGYALETDWALVSMEEAPTMRISGYKNGAELPLVTLR